MNPLVPIAMFGWIPVVLLLFWLLPARRAVITAFLLAWLFLPMVEYKLPGVTSYSKMTATCMGVMLAVLLFDGQQLMKFWPKWFDLPMIVWCLCPYITSITNDLGEYDGFSAIMYQTIIWGLPYFIGRLYFTDMEALRELAIGIVVSGLVYVPLCLIEMRVSPMLHVWVYGFHQHDFFQSMRGGGYRPTVFMQHGLMVGMWMVISAMAGVWLWYSGSLKKLWGMPVEWLMFATMAAIATCQKPFQEIKKLWLMPLGWLVLYLLATAILCKSTGATILLIAGLGALYFAKFTKSSLLLWVLVVCAPLYIGLRASNMWSGDSLVALSERLTNADRADSLAFRMRMENKLLDRAMERPVFGWGGWGRNKAPVKKGEKEAVTDGLWIIAMGTNGIVGLTALTTTILLPAVLFMRRFPAKYWAHSAVAPAAVLAVMLVLYMIDNVPNAMVNPIFIMIAGGLGGTMAAQTHLAGVAIGQGRKSLPKIRYITPGV